MHFGESVTPTASAGASLHQLGGIEHARKCLEALCGASRGETEHSALITAALWDSAAMAIRRSFDGSSTPLGTVVSGEPSKIRFKWQEAETLLGDGEIAELVQTLWRYANERVAHVNPGGYELEAKQWHDPERGTVVSTVLNDGHMVHDLPDPCELADALQTLHMTLWGAMDSDETGN